MRALVVGGRGFIGGAVSRELERLDHEVGLVLGPGHQDTPPGAFAYRPGLYGTLADQLAGLDLVVYAAGQVLPRHETGLEGAVARDGGPLFELLDALAASGSTATFLLVSSAGTVYGPSTDGAPLTEASRPAPVSVYGLSRLLMEESLLLRVRRSTLRPVIFRLSNLYGPGQRTHGGSTFVLHALRAAAGGGPLALMGTGEQTKDFLHVDDLLEALRRLLTRSPGRRFSDPRFNVCAGRSHSLRAVLDLVEEVTGRSVPVVPAPAPAGDVEHLRLSAAKAEAELGWTSRISLAEGIDRMWQALRSCRRAS